MKIRNVAVETNWNKQVLKLLKLKFKKKKKKKIIYIIQLKILVKYYICI